MEVKVSRYILYTRGAIWAITSVLIIGDLLLPPSASHIFIACILVLFSIFSVLELRSKVKLAGNELLCRSPYLSGKRMSVKQIHRISLGEYTRKRSLIFESASGDILNIYVYLFDLSDLASFIDTIVNKQQGILLGDNVVFLLDRELNKLNLHDIDKNFRAIN
jgi:hypothetical protein